MTIITHWNATLTEAVAMAQARDAEALRQGAEAALSRELGGVTVRLLVWRDGGLEAFPELAADVAEDLREPVARLRESYATLIRVATRAQGNAGERQLLASLDAELLVPLQAAAGPMGALAVGGAPSLADLTDERLALLEFIAAQAATALERMAREQALETQHRHLERRIRDLARALTSSVEVATSLNAQGVAQALLLHALGLATASRGAVALADGDGLVTVASRGMPTAEPTLAPPPLTEGHRAAVTADGELYVGFFAHGRLQGVLQLGKRVLGPYGPDEIQLVDGLARHAGVAIAKARAYEAAQGGG
jgi:GAF domain-containing protein